MAYFKNSQECDQVLGNFFRKMAEGVAAKDPVLMEIQRKMAEMSLIVKFVWREPEMTLTLDFTKDPFAVYANDETINPTATITLTADNGHKFWHGQINLAKALTTKTIVARGPIPKILKLLPVIEPMYKRYPAYLKDIGRADLALS
jgi:putative sterol carrier protein